MVCGWNGLAAADSMEFSHRAENWFWSSQRARLQFSLCNLLHTVMILLTSEMLTHHTLQVVGLSHPSGNGCDGLTGLNTFLMKET